MTDWKKINTLDNRGLLGHQERMVRKIVRELNSFGNVIYGIQNEPWSDCHTVRKSPGVVTRVLSSPGQEYALYLRGSSPCELDLDLPKGNYLTEWIDPASGAIAKNEQLNHRAGVRRLASPSFTDEIALRVVRVR